MRRKLILLMVSTMLWGGLTLVPPLFDSGAGGAYAKSGSDDDSEDDEKDDDNSGSGGSGGGGSGSSGSDDDGSDDDRSGNSGPGGGGSLGGSDDGGSDDGGSGGSGAGGSSSGGSGSKYDRSGASSDRFGGVGIQIQFADGRVERIRKNRFEKLDSRGNVIERRTVRRADLDRLRNLGTTVGKKPGVQAVVRANDAQRAIEISDFRGWREIVSGSTYLLKDPNGRTVTRRQVTGKDIARIRAMLDLD